MKAALIKPLIINSHMMLTMMTQNYARVPKIQSQCTSFQTFFRGWTPRHPSYCVPVTNPVEHPPTYKYRSTPM